MDSTRNSFHRLFGNAAAPALLIAPDGRVLAGNPAMALALGQPHRPLAPVRADGLVCAQDAPRLTEACAALQRPGTERLRARLGFRAADGTERVFDCCLRPVPDATGRIEAIVLEAAAPDRPALADTPPPRPATGEGIPPDHHARVLQIAAETAGVGQFYFDLERRRMWATDPYYRMLGFDPGAVALDSAWVRARIHPADLDAAVAAFDRLVAAEVPQIRLRYRLRCRDNSWKWVEVTAQSYRAEDPAVPAMICGSLIDITAHKAAAADLAEALSEAESARGMLQRTVALHRAATESGGIGPWMLDPQTRLETRSDHFYRILGLERSDLADAQDSFLSLVHPEDRAAAIAGIDDLIAGRRESYHADFRVRHRDGSWIWCESSARPVRTAGPGRPPVICGSLKDITARKRNEQRLAEALAEAEASRNAAWEREEMLRTSACSGGIGHWAVCPAEQTGWAPAETYRLLNYAPWAFASTVENWHALVHPADRPGAVAAFDDMLAGRTDTLVHDHRKRHGDGSYHWYRSVARKIDRSARGLADLIAGAMILIDETKERERMLAEAAASARQAGALLQTLADNLPGALYERRQGPDGRIRFPYFSARLPELMGVTRTEISADGECIYARIHPEDRDRIRERRRADDADGDKSRFEDRFRLLHPRHGMRWILVSAVRFQAPDGTESWFGNLMDVTDNMEAATRAADAARAVRDAHERLRSIADNTPGGIFEYRLLPDGRSEFLYTSGQFDELVDTPVTRAGHARAMAFEQIDPEDRPAFIASIHESARRLTAWRRRFRIRTVRHGQRWLSGSATPRREPDGSVCFTGLLLDVTRDVQRENELKSAHLLADRMRRENEHQAMHDGLTGLPNRRAYDQQLAARLRGAAEGRGPRDGVLIRMDLDHFKYVNDTLGHEAGDQVLIRVAEVLRYALRPADFAARIGGDEFSILLGAGVTPAQAREAVERIQARLAAPLMYGGRHCRFGASFGIAHTEDLRETGAELSLFADAALYRAKEAGRNRMEFFTSDLHQSILNDRRLAAEIQEGLEHDEFVPFFQPQVSAEDGRLVGVETLLRWRHPHKGLLAPDAFMHVAEQLRIVPEIDRIMMQKARGALDRWQAQGLRVPKISFNVSSGRMHDPDLVSGALDIAATDTRVTFELLESILVEEESDAFRFHLDKIREAGIDIEIDDFGSGHASIIGVMQIRPSALKIDRRIVSPAARDPQARNLVRAIVEIAETLGIGTVAEGVETQAHADILRGIGCNVLQGYLFARPLSEADLVTYALDQTRQTA
ncbi:hypothetical protein DSD19_17350 [Rhodovulum sp. BSW8]|uniref:PAS domain-containing protein n=1 Tax=Rhodovulum sp. BSW8 TaxID=2259645 RepID=UPI000DE22CA7|nr:PAS domain-containing protein [Rhodovulum sp. BSW8]RBO51870.1 hypothetical protein DSD19_17350 [Rhodovulum sp. BSW8]